jgi:hypothetical protein
MSYNNCSASRKKREKNLILLNTYMSITFKKKSQDANALKIVDVIGTH